MATGSVADSGWAVDSVAGSGGAIGREIDGRGAVGGVADGESAIGVTECKAYDGGAIGNVNYSCKSEELLHVL